MRYLTLALLMVGCATTQPAPEANTVDYQDFTLGVHCGIEVQRCKPTNQEELLACEVTDLCRKYLETVNVTVED